MLVNPNLDKEYRLQKLLRNYNNFGNIVVGIDLDFTLVDAVTKTIYKDVQEVLQRGQRDDIIYCVWTANDDFDYVKERFKEAGISWMYFNSSPINPDAQKPHFNLLLDDSAGLNEALDLFKTFLDEIETIQI